MIRKTITIETCWECPHHVFDDQECVERWGKSWCRKMQREVPYAENIIPKKCPLPDAKDT